MASKIGRHMTFYENVAVRIEFDDILSELSVEDIQLLCKQRGISYRDVPSSEMWREFSDDLRLCQRSGDSLHMEVLIVRMLVLAGVPRLSIPGKEKPHEGVSVVHGVVP
jgi:hypothetical protein